MMIHASVSCTFCPLTTTTIYTFMDAPSMHLCMSMITNGANIMFHRLYIFPRSEELYMGRHCYLHTWLARVYIYNVTVYPFSYLYSVRIFAILELWIIVQFAQPVRRNSAYPPKKFEQKILKNCHILKITHFIVTVNYQHNFSTLFFLLSQ